MSKGIGKTREKLAVILTTLLREGYEIRPENIKKGECGTWGAWSTRIGGHFKVAEIWSYDTMSDCVKFGVELVRSDEWQVRAKNPIYKKHEIYDNS